MMFFKRFTSLVLLCLVVLTANDQSSGDKSSPNFVLIQVDDMGYDDLGVNGNTVANTPNIDQLAEESVRFRNFMLNSVCSPTRASLLTGRDFWRTGISGVHGGKDFMNLNETTFAEILQKNGYSTGMWGKWHTGKTDGYWPWDRGFDEGYYANLYQYYPSNGYYKSPNKKYAKRVKHDGKWSPEQLVDYTLDYINRQKDREQPFFAYLSFMTPHGIWNTPERYKNKYEKKGRSEDFVTFLGMMDFMDQEIGRLLDYLEDHDLNEDTVIMFMSDNGPLNKWIQDEEWELRNNHGFLGNKGKIWKNGLKSPLYVKWEGNYRSATIDRLVTITDIFPTILDIAEVPLPSGNLPLDGRSIKHYLEGNTSALDGKQSFLSRWFPATRKYGKFDPIKDNSSLQFDGQRIAVITEDWKFLNNPTRTPGAPDKYNNDVLVDLEAHPLERKNSASEYRDVLQKMEQNAKQWFRSIKTDTNAFTSPEFQIGWKGKTESEILAYGPSVTEGVQNGSHEISGFDEPGDYAEYQINVHQSGVYDISVRKVKSDGELDMSLRISGSEDAVQAVLDKVASQEIGSVFLPAGKSTLRLEVEPSSSPNIKGDAVFKSLQLQLDDESKGLSDSQATKETANLFRNLKQVGGQNIIFGQHFATVYLQNWDQLRESKTLATDVNEAVGDHPGLFGFDFNHGIDRFEHQVEQIYRRGGIITYSWHMDNPVTRGNSKDLKGNPVKAMLPGGDQHRQWLSRLDTLAAYFKSLKVDGEQVPVIFRPFHEHTGSWFWWGSDNCSSQEFKELWRLTVDYLREEKNVHNILMAYSPAKPLLYKSESEIRYPGDDYVDVIGFDAYGPDSTLKEILPDHIRYVSKWADKKNKIAALTEVGIRKGIQNSGNKDWFMGGLLDLVKETSPQTLSYMLTWRNRSPDNYWVPLSGQPTYSSFVKFYLDDYTYFLDDISTIYEKRGLN